MILDLNEIEIFWIAINLVATGVTTWNLWDSFVSWRIISQANGGGRELVAGSSLIQEGIRFSIQVSLLAVGVLAASSSGAPRVTLAVVLLMYVSVALAVNSIVSRISRHILLRTARDELAREEAITAREDAQDLRDQEKADGR